MSNPVKVLVFAGSARSASLNKRLAALAARAVDAGGGAATLIDLNDYPMPLYHGDLEAKDGVPENARRLKTLFIEHQALLIASPENNASVSSLLKNTLDWISRQDGEQSGLVPYAHKVAALTAASPGALGGLRGLVHLRAILESLGVLVLPAQLAVSRAHEAFAPDGSFKEARLQGTLESLCRTLVRTSARLQT